MKKVEPLGEFPTLFSLAPGGLATLLDTLLTNFSSAILNAELGEGFRFPLSIEGAAGMSSE